MNILPAGMRIKSPFCHPSVSLRFDKVMVEFMPVEVTSTARRFERPDGVQVPRVLKMLPSRGILPPVCAYNGVSKVMEIVPRYAVSVAVPDMLTAHRSLPVSGAFAEPIRIGV